MSKFTYLLSALSLVFMPSVLATPLHVDRAHGSHEVLAAREKAVTIDFEIQDQSGQHFRLTVPADGIKRTASSLSCTNVETNTAAAGCSSIQVSYLPPSTWTNDFCCQIDWNKCYQQGTILGGGWQIDPAQSIDLIRCQATTVGSCGVWPYSKLHNDCE